MLKYLLRKDICPIEVVTKQGSILDKLSASEQLIRHRWPLDLLNESDDKEPFDVGLVASFGQLIDEDTVRKFKYGLFNVHPSLLPRYRGSSPIQAAIGGGMCRQPNTCTLEPSRKRLIFSTIHSDLILDQGEKTQTQQHCPYVKLKSV